MANVNFNNLLYLTQQQQQNLLYNFHSKIMNTGRDDIIGRRMDEAFRIAKYTDKNQ